MSTPRPAGELVDARGRKYLTADERDRFLVAVRSHPKPATQTLARTLALTGCRVSEALGIRACDVDLEAAEVRIATLKRRREHWRAVPIPEELVSALDLVHRVRAAQASPRARTRPLWTVTRQGAHRAVTKLMAAAGIAGPQATPPRPSAQLWRRRGAGRRPAHDDRRGARARRRGYNGNLHNRDRRRSPGARVADLAVIQAKDAAPARTASKSAPDETPTILESLSTAPIPGTRRERVRRPGRRAGRRLGIVVDQGILKRGARDTRAGMQRGRVEQGHHACGAGEAGEIGADPRGHRAIECKDEVGLTEAVRDALPRTRGPLDPDLVIGEVRTHRCKVQVRIRISEIRTDPHRKARLPRPRTSRDREEERQRCELLASRDRDGPAAKAERAARPLVSSKKHPVLTSLARGVNPPLEIRLPIAVADRPNGATHVRVNGATDGC